MKRSSLEHSESERSTSNSSTESSHSSNRLEEDSFDEGIDDILAQVGKSFSFHLDSLVIFKPSQNMEE